MPRILRSKTFWIGAVAGAVVGPFVIKKVTPKITAVAPK